MDVDLTPRWLANLHSNKHFLFLVKFAYFLRKRMLTNPKKGPIHFKSPARILWRTVRGMLRHKTPRGANALGRMTCVEGIPHPYDKIKRKVVPSALRNIRLKPGRKYCRLGDLSAAVGWSHNDLLGRLEEQRKVQSAAYHNTKTVSNFLSLNWLFVAH